MKKAVGKQKKKLKQDVLKAKDIENDISASKDKDQKANAEKMMIKQEKIIKEEKIIKMEKVQIKSVKKLIKKVENPAASKKEDDAKNKQENPEHKPAEKSENEPATDAGGKALVPNPPPYGCFYIMYPERDAQGRDVVLEIEQKDKYHPKKTGLYNVRFHPFEGGEEEEGEEGEEEGEEGGHHDHAQFQQWMYDPVTHKLHTKAF